MKVPTASPRVPEWHQAHAAVSHSRRSVEGQLEHDKCSRIWRLSFGLHCAACAPAVQTAQVGPIRCGSQMVKGGGGTRPGVRQHLVMRDPLVIHVVRHGRTHSNRVGVVMGWADESIELDQHDAADALAERLAAAPAPVRLVSSPLARARDTAAPLAAALTVDLETDARLGELYQGPWQGLAESDVAQRWPLEWSVWRTAPETLDLDERETLTALYARVADAFDDLVLSSDAATVVVFTHDAVVRAAVAWTLRVGPATYRHIDVANCSITTIHASSSGSRLVALNDTSHLTGSER
jgi:broad specificity phosphatase PhoE